MRGTGNTCNARRGHGTLVQDARMFTWARYTVVTVKGMRIQTRQYHYNDESRIRKVSNGYHIVHSPRVNLNGCAVPFHHGVPFVILSSPKYSMQHQKSRSDCIGHGKLNYASLPLKAKYFDYVQRMR